MASSTLVRLARAAAKASKKAADAQRAWVAAFVAEYGHDDISDALVGLIDYGGDGTCITAAYIDEHSQPGQSDALRKIAWNDVLGTDLNGENDDGNG